MAKEIELKLAFPPSAQALIENHPLLQRGVLRGDPKFLDNTYFDTPDLALHNARVAVRVRDTGSERLQTVKCAAPSVGGLSSRPEWEGPYRGEFDFSAVDAEETRILLDARCAALLPVFTTAFRRVTRQFEPRPGVRILIMLDTGKILSAGRETTISELELELAEGTAADLQDFAIELAQALPLMPFDDSKAQRGYQLFLNEPVRPLKAAKSAVEPAMNTPQAFLALANQGMTCWQGNLHGMVVAPQPEFIHQFRVALRRLNTLLRVFKPALPGDFAERWAPELKALASTTGEVRDLDVMLENVLQPMLDSKDKVRQKLVKRAIEACDQARAAADLPLEKLLNGDTLLRFAREINALHAKAVKQEITGFAEKRLGWLHRKAMKRFQTVVRSHKAADAHRFRIALKHLRYGCEFFANLFGEAEMLQYAREVAALQDELGFLNDLYVALSRLDHWADADTSLDEVRDYIARWYTGRMDDQFVQALANADALLRKCLPWCGECERHGFKSARKQLKQGVSVKFV